ERVRRQWAVKKRATLQVKANAAAIGDETRLCESDRPESVHVRADDVVGESTTIHIQPVIRADRAEMRVLDRAVLQTAASRRVCSKKQTVPELSVQAAEDDRGVRKSLQNAMTRRSETQRGIGIGRLNNCTRINCKISAW